MIDGWSISSEIESECDCSSVMISQRWFRVRNFTRLIVSTSKNGSRTSWIPAGLVQWMTAYFWFSHKLHWLYISDKWMVHSDKCIQFEISKPVIQVMAWCRQASSHYLKQCWPCFMMSFGITRPQWINGFVQDSSHTLCNRITSL